MTLEHEAVTERIIGEAIEVHFRLGPGLLASLYQKAFIIELRKRSRAVRDQMEGRNPKKRRSGYNRKLFIGGWFTSLHRASERAVSIELD